MTIKNKATARLYVYTPYTPNKAALTNLYGLGDSCSTYGNRNFWRIFNDWFGSSVFPASSVSFVHSLFTDLLARDATASELFHYSRGITAVSARTSRAAGQLKSAEYRTSLVSGLYLTYLGSPGTPAAIASWVAKIRSGVVAQDSMPARILGLGDFYRAAGATPDAFVNAVYQQILQRTPTAGELAQGLRIVKVHSRATFALAIWNTTEHNLARAAAAYQAYLGRAASVPEQSAAAKSIKGRGYYGWLSTLLGSSEYAARANQLFPPS
jgi:hypothetical protein